MLSGNSEIRHNYRPGSSYLVDAFHLWMLSIMQAMKVENMVKLKEEFDYKSLCRRLEAELDRLVAENERQVKAREDTEDDSARSLEEARQSVFEAERKLASALEVC